MGPRKDESSVILFTLFNEGPIPGHDDKYQTGITGRRWALCLERWGISWEHHCLYGDKVHFGPSYYTVGVHLDPRLWFQRFGRTEIQYDGFHNSFQVGPFYVSWWSPCSTSSSTDSDAT